MQTKPPEFRPTTPVLHQRIASKLGSSCAQQNCKATLNLQLQSCQHTWCVDCLGRHICVMMACARLPLRCPAPGCAHLLDPVVTLLCLSLPQRKLCDVQQIRTRVDVHPLWNWCPNEFCLRAMKLDAAGEDRCFINDCITPFTINAKISVISCNVCCSVEVTVKDELSAR